MKKTVCELFAGVGGFRCGLNKIKSLEPVNEKWETVWFSQWEPAEKNTQYAHDCYVYRFGTCLNLDGKDTTNNNVENVDKKKVPDFNLLVGGFPCQDYSVASSLATSRGLEGKKGVLWWSIREFLEKKKPPFVLLENVDRLLKSPARQRGRDFGVILACFRDEGYTVEWRVINAADYGFQQRRRRTFIFAYKETTKFAKKVLMKDRSVKSDDFNQKILSLMTKNGFFAQSFPAVWNPKSKLGTCELSKDLGKVSESFRFGFENTGVLYKDTLYTIETKPIFKGKQITLGDVMETEEVDKSYFIPKEKLYYTDPNINHCDETKKRLPAEKRLTWQYIKGGKKLLRKSKSGYEYIYSEGPIPMLDAPNKPSRTMLTSEGIFSRSTHIVKDKKNGEIRLLTACETERLQGFPTNHTKYCVMNGKVKEVPLKKRRFLMGNALVVNLIAKMEPVLSKIFEAEGK